MFQVVNADMQSVLLTMKMQIRSAAFGKGGFLAAQSLVGSGGDEGWRWHDGNMISKRPSPSSVGPRRCRVVMAQGLRWDSVLLGEACDRMQSLIC